MKQLAKYFILSCLPFFLIAFATLKVQATPAADEVAFGLQSESISTQDGSVRRATFSLHKGSNTEPVTLTTTIAYDTALFNAPQSMDVKPHPILGDKILSTNFDENSGIIRVSLGIEDYDINNPPLPDGNLFSIDFKALPDVNPTDDSITLNDNIELGPNQASSKDATLLKVTDDAGMAFDNGSMDNEVTTGKFDASTGAADQSCFISALH